MSEYARISEILSKGSHVPTVDVSTEALPIFTTTAFTWHSLSEAEATYQRVEAGSDYTYIRTCNPNRDALAEVVSYLEDGESTIICSSGMGAISATLLTLVEAGDHVLYSNCCYGESLDIMHKLFKKFGIEVSAVDIADLDAVKAAIKPNTKLIYTETIANPALGIADVEKLSEMAHEVGAYLIVDNTFCTAIAYQPLHHGADIVVNSLTKFMNGHSDAVCGAVTGPKELVSQIRTTSGFTGTPSDPFTAWLVLRGIKTIDMRLPIQLSNAAKLAAALEADPHVLKVLHPSLESHPQHALALEMFESNEKMTAMVSIYVPEDIKKMDDFMLRMKFAHYAPTLGGIRTTYQCPWTSSHRHNTDEERAAVGITQGMIRISVGCENIDDLIKDFTEALKAFD